MKMKKAIGFILVFCFLVISIAANAERGAARYEKLLSDYSWSQIDSKYDIKNINNNEIVPTFAWLSTLHIPDEHIYITEDEAGNAFITYTAPSRGVNCVGKLSISADEKHIIIDCASAAKNGAFIFQRDDSASDSPSAGTDPEKQRKSIAEDSSDTMNPELRFDGLYYNYKPEDQTNSVFRFYDDGRAISASISDGEGEKGPSFPRQKWFNIEEQSKDVFASTVTYFINDKQIEINSEALFGSVLYNGEISYNKLILSVKSYNGHVANNLEYIFIPFEDLPEWNQ